MVSSPPPGSEGATPARGLWYRRLPTLAYHLVLAGSVLALGVLLVWKPVLGRYDFWAHAAVGRWICENGRVPDRSLFLWTADEPWVYHSWLAQVVFYALTCVGAPQALADIILGFTAAVALTPFALAWWLWCVRAGPSCWMAIPFAIALMGTSSRFQTRPELFTALFLSLLLANLSRTVYAAPVRRGRWLETCAVLVGFTVWGNMHGAVVIGLLVLLVTAGCDLLQNRRDGGWRHPALLALLAPLAVCINPYGISYWVALEPVGSERFGEILEWYPLWRGPSPGEPVLVAAILLPALAAVAWALNPDRRFAQLGWLLMFAGMCALARRNVWPLSVASLLVLATNARTLDPALLWARIGQAIAPRTRLQLPPPILRWGLRGVVLVSVVLYALSVAVLVRPWRPFTPTRLDDGIVKFVEENRIAGRVFNDYENSSFLQWRFRGHPALYIDLLNAYPDQVVTDYRAIVSLSDRGKGLLDEQGIEIVILTTNRGAGASLAKLGNYLDRRPEWARVYTDADGVVWVRRTPELAHLWQSPKRPFKPVEFAVLEQWGEESTVLSPPTIPEKWR